MEIRIIILASVLMLPSVVASNGDRTQFFHNCRENCERQNCSADGIQIQEQAIKYYRQSIFDKLFQWTCADECQFGCMWKTVDAFHERNWDVPQFYGKWPFARFLGMQEPASVFFSILNFIAQLRFLRKFRREVRKDSPCFKIWHIFAIACLSGWVCSAIFHTRDFPLTELLDYSFAYAITLSTLFCTAYRMIHNWSALLRILVTIIFLSYFINYFAYLSVGKFSYSFNIKVNVGTGALSAMIWFVWCYMVKQQRPYYRRVLRFYFLCGLAMSLELLDFPPIGWILDAHALWHLATVPLVPIFYNFIIEDCKALHKEKLLASRGSFNKQI